MSEGTRGVFPGSDSHSDSRLQLGRSLSQVRYFNRPCREEGIGRNGKRCRNFHYKVSTDPRDVKDGLRSRSGKVPFTVKRSSLLLPLFTSLRFISCPSPLLFFDHRSKKFHLLLVKTDFKYLVPIIHFTKKVSLCVLCLFDFYYFVIILIPVVFCFFVIFVQER